VYTNAGNVSYAQLFIYFIFMILWVVFVLQFQKGEEDLDYRTKLGEQNLTGSYSGVIMSRTTYLFSTTIVACTVGAKK